MEGSFAESWSGCLFAASATTTTIFFTTAATAATI